MATVTLTEEEMEYAILALQQRKNELLDNYTVEDEDAVHEHSVLGDVILKFQRA